MSTAHDGGPEPVATAAEGPHEEAAQPAVARRDEILAIAAKIIARKGFARTTVRDIAREAGILSGSLYHHFASKDELLEEIIRAALDPAVLQDEQLAGDSEIEPETAIRLIFSQTLRFVTTNRDVFRILMDSSKDVRDPGTQETLLRRRATIHRAWCSVLQRGVDEGALRADLDVDLAYRSMQGAINNVIRWYDPDDGVDLETVAEQMASLFLDGARTDTSARAGVRPGDGACPQEQRRPFLVGRAAVE